MPKACPYNMREDLQRATLLFGEEKMQRLGRARVIVFGLGGVGSWCAEALLRSGVGHLTLVDADDVDVTNINRQLPATVCTIGRPKAEVLLERLTAVRPDADVKAVVKFYTTENAGEFALDTYDVVIDAIDSLASKADLLMRVTAMKGVRIYSSMGAARRLDPGRVSVAEFWKVRGCALARALRDRFKRAGIKPSCKISCVYSDEPVSGEPKGTSMAVTATFGLRLAALAIDGICSD